MARRHGSVLLAAGALLALTASPRAQAANGFTLSFQAPQDAKYQPWMAAAQQSSLLRTMTAVPGGALALPRTVPVTFQQCRKVNAWYSHDTQSITFCYELMEDMAGTFRRSQKTAAAVTENVVDASIMVLMHEIGHALVHQLNLTVTWNREDAADQASALLLLWAGQWKTAFRGARALRHFNRFATSKSDTHSTGEARFVNTACMVYGSDTSTFAAFVDPDVVPAGRAPGCRAEYEKQNNTWNALLKPYLRKKK